MNPLTRQPCIPPGDLREIKTLLGVIASWGRSRDEEVRERHVLVGQNVGFDVHALEQLGLSVPWPMVRDTLVASHLLNSSTPHDLTSLAVQYLGVDILPYEEAVKKAVQECRRRVQQARLKRKRTRVKADSQQIKGTKFLFGVEEPEELVDPLPTWRIAEEGLEEMPSTRGDKWHADMWLPRAMVNHLWESSEAGKL